MARALLKEKPKPPQTRRVRFQAPVDVAERMDALIAQAEQAGFELDLDAAMAEAYAGIARKLERELADASGAASSDDAAGSATGQPDGGDSADLGTAA
jgi:hypothetical protein